MGRAILVGILAVAAASRCADAQEIEPERQVEELRRRMDAMERRHREEMDALREELRSARDGERRDAPGRGGVSEAVDEYLARTESLERRVDRLAAASSALRTKYVDISLGGLFAAGGSTASEAELLDLQGGGHDPRKRGFTAQNIEMSFAGAVDPYLRGEAHLVWNLDEGGESVVELEEAFVTTTSLPWGFQAKAGQYFTEFGRLNPTHPHTWEFVDQPVVNSRMFGGDGMRGPGARLSWLAPTPFSLEVLYGAQNGNGETMTSFIGEDPLGGRPAAGRQVRSWGDLAQSARAAASWELGDATTALLGTSAAWGPNGTGRGGATRIHGGDLTLKWRPPTAAAGFPFLSWQTEYLWRRYAADTFNEPGSGLGFHPHDVFQDRGFYSQLTWGFHRGWTLGVRWEQADGAHGGNAADAARDRRSRASVAVTHYLSEFSRVRLQVSRDRSEALGHGATTVWLQFEFLLGSHGAHAF